MSLPTTQHSIGGLYAAASIYAVHGLEDPGKLMGLAPYGRPGVHDFEIFELCDGRVFVRQDWMRRFENPSRGHDHFRRHFQEYADLAWWVQREVERALLYVVDQRHAIAPAENLAYAGGVALNAVANRRIVRESKFRNVWFEPAAGDNGLAVGAAYYGWLVTLGRERVLHDGSTCLGRAYSSAAIDDAVGDAAVERPADVVTRTAELLADGEVVAWFQGRSEFGPRALGHRSILADP
jgi:carbamoyltransferase